MRFVTSPLNYLYRGSIPGRSRLPAVAFWAFVIVLASAAMVSFFGAASLVILPGIYLVYAAFRYRMFLLYILLGSFPITNYFFGGIHTVFSYSVVMLLIALWFCRKTMLIEKTLILSKYITGYIIVFMLALLVTSLDEGIRFGELLVIVRFVIYFSLVIVLYDMYEPRYTVPIIISITIPLLISAYFTFGKFLQVRGLFDFLDLYRMKPAGIFSNANSFGGRLLFAAPFWTALAFWSDKRYVRISSTVLASISIVALILTNSRSAIVGIAVMFLFYFGLAKKLKYFFAICAVIGIVYLSSPAIKAVVSAGFRVERGSSTRDVIWKNTIDMIEKNFWLGIGVGNFPREYDKYLVTAFDQSFFGNVANHAHNEILHKTVEMGIMGLFLILALYYYPVRHGIALHRKHFSKGDRAIIYGLTGTLVANYAKSFFEANTLIGAGGLYPPVLFWLTCMMIIKLNQEYEFGPDKKIFDRGKTF